MEVEEAALRKRIEHQDEEMIRLHDTIEDQTASIDNLNVRRIQHPVQFAATDSVGLQRLLAEATSGVEGGREFAQAVQELERTKRTSELQQAEFESVKRNLMRDVTDRCEKVQLAVASSSVWTSRINMQHHSRSSSCKCSSTNTRRSTKLSLVQPISKRNSSGPKCSNITCRRWRKLSEGYDFPHHEPRLCLH